MKKPEKQKTVCGKCKYWTMKVYEERYGYGFCDHPNNKTEGDTMHYFQNCDWFEKEAGNE